MTQDSPGNMATDRPCCNAVFDAIQMQDDLGTMSSHPAHAALRMLVWGLVAIAPLFAAVLVVVAWLRDGSTDPVRFLINHGRVITVYGLSATGFALGFGLTAFAATVASRSQMLIADDTGELHRDPSVARLVAATLVMLFLLGLAVWAVPLLIEASSQTRLLVAWLGLLPLVLLLSLATFLPHEDSAGRLMSRPWRLWAFILPAAVLSLVAATRLRAASEWLEQWRPIRVPLQLFLDASGGSGLAPDAVESMKSWLVTGIVGVAAIPLLGLALAAVSAMGRGLEVVVGGARRPSLEPRVWRQDLLASLWTDDAGTTAEETIAADGAEQYFVAGDKCIVFFAERPVTREQAAAFNQIASLADEHLTTSPAVPTQQTPSADFILEGPEGSGRTATMIAALIHGALMHGDTALVLVADEARRESLLARLRAATSVLHVDGFIGIGTLTESTVSEWADSANALLHRAAAIHDTGPSTGREKARGEVKIPPRILVGTLGNLEQCAFDAVYGFAAIQEILHALNTVAIDDVDRFSMSDRLHLPYVLAKIRLILAAEGQVMRTLLTTRPIADAARELVAGQLLKTGFVENHFAKLHRLPLPEGASLSTLVRSLPYVRGRALIDQLATWGRACLDRSLDAVVVAPHLTEAEQAEISDRCQESRNTPRGKVHVVRCLDALPTLGSGDHLLVASAACSVIGRRDVAAFVVAWQSGDPTAVVFCVAAGDPQPAVPEAEHALLVLPGKESESLFARHFASAARFLPYRQPVPRWYFSAMGLPPAGKLTAPPAGYRPQSDGLVPLSDRVIALDPLESDVAVRTADPVRWPWCALLNNGDGRPPAPHPVAINGAVPNEIAVQMSDSGDSITLRERPTVRGVQEVLGDQRTAIWRNSDGSELARDDLAYMHSFLLESGRGKYIPTQIHRSSQGPAFIDARPVFQATGAGMPVMPALELYGLPMPSGITLKRLLQSAPLAHRVSVLGLAPPASRATASGVFGKPQIASLRLMGLYDDFGRLREWNLPTCYEAAKFFVLFDGKDALASMDALQDQLLCDWGPKRPESHDDFPELAAAITAAMRWQAPGLERLVRCVGFRITRSEGNPLVGLVFIEPRSTESSGFALMEPIVYDLDVMAEFFSHAATVLDEAAKSPDPAATLYGRAGCVINPGMMNGQLSVRLNELSRGAALFHSIAQEARSLGR